MAPEVFNSAENRMGRRVNTQMAQLNIRLRSNGIELCKGGSSHENQQEAQFFYTSQPQTRKKRYIKPQQDLITVAAKQRRDIWRKLTGNCRPDSQRVSSKFESSEVKTTSGDQPTTPRKARYSGSIKSHSALNVRQASTAQTR